MHERTSLGLLLKRYRLSAGLSQEALAQRADLSARAISDLERGLHRTPHIATLDLLAAALALSVQQRTLLLAAARPELADAPQAPVSRSAAALPQRLPSPPTTLIGRESEYAQALTLLRHGMVRLVTITGPSGVGKTRLALQVAHSAADDFPDGAVFVDLSTVRDAALVSGALIQALRLREQGDAPLVQQALAYLSDKRMLLLFDNFEQVVAAAPIVADLLTWCPMLSILVTSRTPLHLRGEQTLPLAPLALEDAIVLFRERAHAVRPGGSFAVAEVAAVCEKVDCLPLAIELIAGQALMLSLPQIRDQIDQHAPLALEGARDLPARQRTMEAAISWSYDLLTEAQRSCFRALAVFAGGFTLAAARAVGWQETDAATEAEQLLALAALVDASLIQAEITPDGYARLHLLELVRDYALERLRAAGEENERRRRHATWFATLADPLMSSGLGTRADALGQELANVRAALEWAAEQGDAVLGLRLTGFGRLWHVRGMVGEAERWLATMLALDAQARAAGAPTAPLTLRVERLYGYARVLLSQGELDNAETLAREAVTTAQQEETGDASDGLSNAWATLGMIAQARGDLEQASAAFTESVACAGPDARSEARYRALYYLAELSRYQGDLDQAHTLLKQALAGAEAAENGWDSAIMTTLLAHLERQRQDYVGARRRYLDSLARFHRFGSPTYFAWSLEGLCALLCAEGEYASVTSFCAAATAFRAGAHTPLPTAERAAFEETLAQARAALGDAAFNTIWAAGSTLSMAEALAEAVEHS
jgi:predicted ATPase/transcriptional regulator with XRE-family HTH domain